MADKLIKSIQIDSTTVPHELAAKYIQSGSITKTWADIESLVTAGFTIEAPWTESDYKSASAPSVEKKATVPAVTIKYNNGASTTTGTLAASDSETRRHIYLIYNPIPTTGSGNFDEYVSTGTVWEKIGNTDVDLSTYAKKTEAGKAGTYTASTPSVNVTSSAGSQTATGSATVTYKKSAEQTGSAGNATINTTNSGATGASANTGEAGSATVNGSNFTFTGTSATISVESEAATIDDHSYQPAGTISAVTAAAHSHEVDSHTHAAAQTVLTSGSSFTANGDDTFGQGTLPKLTVTNKTLMAQMASTVAVDVVASISGGTASSTATVNKGYTYTDPTFNTTNVVTGYNSFNGGTFTQGAKANLVYAAASTAAALVGATVSAQGVLSWTTSNFNTDASKITSWTTNGTDSFTPASLGAASTTAAYTSIKTAGAITSSGTCTVVNDISAITTTTEKLTPMTIGSASGWSAGSLPTFTQGTKASFTAKTVSVAGAASAATLTSKSAGSINVTPTFTGTTATLAHSFSDATVSASMSGSYKPAGTIGGSQTIAAHSHSYTKPADHSHSVTISSHTHSIALSDATITGTASVAVSSHTHDLGNHTHSVTISNCVA